MFKSQICPPRPFLPHLLEALEQRVPVHPPDPVSADVEVRQPEPVLHVVVVAHLLDVVALQRQPEQRLGREGVVEPLEAVPAAVQPLQAVLGRQQAVQVLQQVAVQAEGLKERGGGG